MGGPSGPPDKFTYIDTTNKTPAEVSTLLWESWEAGFQGPYVVVGPIIYIAGYKEQP